MLNDIIVDVACQYFGHPKKLILDGPRTRALSLTRKYIAYALRIFRYTHQDIANSLRWDCHTTSMYNIKSFNDLLYEEDRLGDGSPIKDTMDKFLDCIIHYLKQHVG